MQSYQEVEKLIVTYDGLTGNSILNYVKTGLCNRKEQDKCSCEEKTRKEIADPLLEIKFYIEQEVNK